MRTGIIIALTTLLIGCNQIIGERGNDERITETYEVEEFNRIEISGAFNIILTPSNDQIVKLEVDDNLVKFIDIEVRGNKLYVETDRRLDSRGGINVKIPVKDLKGLSSSGASNIRTTDVIISNSLKFDLSGAGKMELELDAENVKIDLSGAGLVYLEGAAKLLDVDMSGAGSLEADALEAEDCTIDISGVGNAVVNVTGTLEAQVSGLGNVEYVGNPKSVKGDVSGIGEVNRK
ncbi:MAG: head GIN domain-containing protein [Bacteroidota bacterium]